MREKERFTSYDLIRILGTLLVVIGHSTYLEWSGDMGTISLNAAEYSENFSIWQAALSKIGGLAYMFHMPLFFALSGALYAHGSKPDLSNLVRKKAKRLLLPYFLVGFLWMFPIKYFVYFYSDWFSLCKALIYFLTGKNAMGHLWFLPALFVCTILFWIIERASDWSGTGGDWHFLLVILCRFMVSLGVCRRDLAYHHALYIWSILRLAMF